MKKSPWLAAILNFFFFGGGYIYNGKRVGYGAALVVGCVFVRFGEIPIYLTHLVNTQWAILFTGLVIMQLNFAIDGYKEAKSISK